VTLNGWHRPEGSLSQLEAWGDRAATAATLDDVFGT
jgi:hypothetical protein